MPGINWVLKKGETTAEAANDFKVSRRRIQQLIKLYKETGEYHVLNMKRRPKTHLTDEQKKVIKQAYNETFLGAKLLRHYIKQKIPSGR